MAIRACKALWSMATDVANRVPIVKAGGIQAILTAMARNVGNPDVNQYGCMTLVNLALNDAHKVTIVAAGAIPVILKAMTAHAAMRV